jgi:hypothetical protein
MPTDDFLDPAQEARRLKKAQQRAWVSGGQPGGDSGHAGSGADSIQLGDGADASGDYSTAVAAGAHALAEESLALGYETYVDPDHWNSSAIGRYASTTRNNQIMLGTGGTEVAVADHLNLPLLGPSSSGDPLGHTGDVRIDANYIYVKTGSGWKRAALSTF